MHSAGSPPADADHRHLADRGLGLGYIAALLVLQLSFFSRPGTRLRSPQSYALLFVQACLIYLPLLPAGPDWVSLPGLLAGSALLVLPPVAGWMVFVLSVALVVWSHLADHRALRPTIAVQRDRRR